MEEGHKILLLVVTNSNQLALESNNDWSILIDVRSAHCSLVTYRVVNLQGRRMSYGCVVSKGAYVVAFETSYLVLGFVVRSA
jgi:hypothetical protein